MMLRYNTQLKPLVLPEYGRNIQEMVDYCLTLEKREERTRCAYTIVDTMANIFPELKSGGEYNHKLWDHLAIMSDFKLDIDYPCEVIQSDSLHTHPEKVEYVHNDINHKLYGDVIFRLIDTASHMEPGEDRDNLVMLIANHMKKISLTNNIDAPDDIKIFKDLLEMSHGILRLDPQSVKLREYIPVAQSGGKKKKKK